MVKSLKTLGLACLPVTEDGKEIDIRDFAKLEKVIATARNRTRHIKRELMFDCPISDMLVSAYLQGMEDGRISEDFTRDNDEEETG